MGRKVKRSTRKRTTRKRSTRKQRGRGVMDVLKKVHTAIKSHKLVSRGLRMAGKPGLANAAAMLGYGRRKKGTRKRVGLKGSLGAVLGLAAPVKRRRKKSTMRGRGISPILRTPGIMSGRGVSMSKPVRARTMKGRGFFGKTLGGVAGGLLGGLLPF